MNRFTSPHFAVFVWGSYALMKTYGYWSGDFSGLRAFQDEFPLTLWVLWLIAGVICLTGAITHSRLCRVTQYARIIGISFVSFLLVLKGLAFISAFVPDVGWISGVNYLMLAIAALTSASFVGKDHSTPDPPIVVDISGGELDGFSDDSS